jgi:hypothetical protein
MRLAHGSLLVFKNDNQAFKVWGVWLITFLEITVKVSKRLVRLLGQFILGRAQGYTSGRLTPLAFRPAIGFLDAGF